MSNGDNGNDNNMITYHLLVSEQLSNVVCCIV